MTVGVAAGERTPAGYLVKLQLAGEDAATKSVVVRGGAEIAGKLMMPLYDGDVVFVRDPKSKVGIELGDGTTMTLGQGLARFELKGEIDTGDGMIGILTAIAGVFAGEDEQTPENMAAKGASLAMPMAVRGSNIIMAGRDTLWLAWVGGKAPYTIALQAVNGQVLESTSAVEQLFAEVPLAATKGQKFTAVITDSEGQRVPVRFRFADALPGDAPVTGTSQASFLAKAAWLTSQYGWRVEAAQMLNGAKTDAALALRDRIVTGWTFEPAAQ
jgi:hypothetical protein